jgi:hypothetical protein
MISYQVQCLAPWASNLRRQALGPQVQHASAAVHMYMGAEPLWCVCHGVLVHRLAVQLAALNTHHAAWHAHKYQKVGGSEGWRHMREPGGSTAQRRKHHRFISHS